MSNSISLSKAGIATLDVELGDFDEYKELINNQIEELRSELASNTVVQSFSQHSDTGEQAVQKIKDLASELANWHSSLKDLSMKMHEFSEQAKAINRGFSMS